jgi:iron complex outermembrane receptor protein
MNRPLITERVDNSSFAIADTLGFFDDDLKVTVGLRRQTINTSSYDFNTGAKSSEYNESTTTPVYGISYRLTDTTAVYANVIEGLVKGDTAPALNSANNPVANAGQALAPYKVKQQEIGIKHETADYGGSLSAYSTEKPIAGVDNNNVFRELSEQEIRGLELFAFGKPSSALTVLGGLSLMDSETDHKDSIGSPDLQANIGLDYELESVPNLTLTSRYTYTSTQYADADNTQKVPAWSTLDLGARYSVFLSGGNVLNVRAAVTNVTDEDQWVSVGGYPGSGYLVLGAPRTLSITTSLEF